MTSLPILLPEGFSTRVTPGDIVKPGDTLADRTVSKEQSVDIAAELRVPIKKVKDYLLKNPGDSVSPGDVIASKKKLTSKEDIISNTKGTVTKFERDTGRVVILIQDNDASPDSLSDGEVERIVSPIDGVVDICDNDRILLKTDKDVLVGEKGHGQEAEAEIYDIPPDGNEEGQALVQLHQLDVTCIDKIILGEQFDRDVLGKAIGMGVKGVIGLEIGDEEIHYLADRRLDTPVIQVTPDSYKKLKKWSGKKIYMQGNNKSILLLHT